LGNIHSIAEALLRNAAINDVAFGTLVSWRKKHPAVGCLKNLGDSSITLW
jgi:hypothetical protein